MIVGTVSEQRALIRLTVVGPTETRAEVTFRIDTGFTASITLPPEACARLALPRLREQTAGAAGGTRLTLQVHEAKLIGDGVEMPIEVLALPGAPLLGMAALEGYEVHLDVREGGRVTITRTNGGDNS